MKLKTITLMLLACLFSMTATAQENVKKAFSKFVSSKKVSVTKTISEEHDVTKESLPVVAKAEVYTFTIKKKDLKLIDEVLAAFEKDRENANVYSVLTHNGGRGIPTNGRELLVGNDRKNSVYIGMNDVESWQLLCLIDPADVSRSHRYAYAIEWNDDPKQVLLSGKIRGKLVVTYSPIPQDVLNMNSGKSQPSSGNKRSDDLSSEHIVNEVYHMGLAGNFDRFENETQMLMAFDALKTEFLKGNMQTKEGGTLAMTIYSLCSHMAPRIKNNRDLRLHLIDELNMIINNCDPDTELGKSHIGYLKLAIKALK